MTLVKHDKKRSIQEGTITMGFCSREERSASIPNTTKESEKLQPGSSMGEVSGKLLRQNIRNRILAKLAQQSSC